jgi:hypothetical protein
MKVFILMRQSGRVNYAGKFTDPPTIVDVFADKKDAQLYAKVKNAFAKSSHYYIKTKELK